MAGPYYVDIATIGAWNARNGLSSGACWYGMTGLQNAFDRVLVGEICYLMGTGNLNVNYTIPYDANSGNLTDGEAVTWHDGAGVVHFLGAMATPVQIELSSGNPPSDGDVCTGTTSTSTVTAHTGVAKYTIDIDTNAGTNAAGWIKFIGVKSDWTVDGTRAIVDGKTTSNNHGLSIAKSMLWFENVEVKALGGSSMDGFVCVTGVNGLVMINCSGNTCSGAGFNNYNAQVCTFIRCVAYSNTESGFFASNGYNNFLFCCARDNTIHGFQSPYLGDVLFGCVAHGNTDDGISAPHPASHIINCVADGNSDDGIDLAASTNLYAQLIIGSRVTNHSGAGDNGLTLNGEPCIVGWSYFEDNTDNINDHTSALFQFIPLEGGSTTSNLEDLANTNEGYVDDLTHDFSTGYTDGGDPDLRRVAITVPWT